MTAAAFSTARPPRSRSTNATLSGNITGTGGDGGGIFNGGDATLTNVTLAHNSADNGGGLFNDGGTTTLTNTTLSGNLGFYGGGGISNNAGTVDADQQHCRGQ